MCCYTWAMQVDPGKPLPSRSKGHAPETLILLRGGRVGVQRRQL